MFYPEQKIKDLLRCGVCRERFDEPKLLPCCSETVCLSCVDRCMLLEDTSSVHRSASPVAYRCVNCGDETCGGLLLTTMTMTATTTTTTTATTQARSFATNRFVAQLMRESPLAIYRGEPSRQLADEVTRVNTLASTVHDFYTHRAAKIGEYCDGVRRQLELAAESLVERVQGYRDDELRVVDRFEADALGAASVERMGPLVAAKLALVDESRACTLRWRAYLARPDTDDRATVRALDRCRTLAQHATAERDTCRDVAFSYRALDFAAHVHPMSKETLGRLQVSDWQPRGLECRSLSVLKLELVAARTLDVAAHVADEPVRCVSRLTRAKLALAGKASGSIKVVRVDSGAGDGGGALAHSLAGHTAAVTCMVTLGDYRLASGSEDGTVKVWTLLTNVCVRTLVGHTGHVTCLLGPAPATSGQRPHLISGSSDCTIRVWDLGADDEGADDAARCVATLASQHTADVLCMTRLFGERLASSGADGKVFVWSLTSMECVAPLAITSEHAATENGNGDGDGGGGGGGGGGGSSVVVRCLAQWTDNRLVGGACNGAILVWNTDNFACEQNVSAFSAQINCMEPFGGNYLLCALEDKQMAVYDLERAQSWLHTPCSEVGGRVHCLAFLDNSHVVTVSNDETKKIRVWSVI